MVNIDRQLITRVLMKTKLLLGINNYELDNLLMLYIESACRTICDKTNRNKFPEDLEYIVIDLVVNRYNSSKKESDISAIQSITETDRSITYMLTNQNRLNTWFNSQMKDYETVISRYKLVYRS